MTPDALSRLLPEVIAIAQAAGEAILRVYETAFSVARKLDDTPVTEADMAAHHIIHERLSVLTPDIPQICEESLTAAFEQRRQWQHLWLIDPLDGTREFIKRNGEFTVNIALIADHEPVLGVVYAPVTRACYYAARGLGAHKQIEAQPPAPIHTRRAPARLAIAGSRSHAGDTLNNLLAKIGDYEITALGSSLKSCRVAEGLADLYPRFGPTSEWDTAAAQCIVEEAGGQITDTQLRPLRYNTKESMLNPDFLVFGDAAVNWGGLLAP